MTSAQRRRRVLELAIIGILLAVYLIRFVLPILTEHGTPRADDFHDYLNAAHQIASGQDPYADFIRTHVPWDWSLNSGYIYPPVFAAMLIPFTWLSMDTAVRLWLILIQLMVLASLIVVYRGIGRPTRAELLGVTAVTTSFFPLAANVWTGAMNTVSLLLLTLAWAAWRRRRDGLAGGLIGFAAIVKIFPVALLPYLAWRRHARLCLAMIATGMVGIGLCFLVTTVDHNLYYFRVLLPHLSTGTGYRENQSLAGMAARLCDPSTSEHGGAAGWCGRIVTWPAVAGVVALVLVATRRTTRVGLEFGLAVCALPLLSTVTWSFHLVLLLFPIALLIREVVRGTVTRGQRRLLLVAWGCFALAPLVHYALILDPITVSPGPAQALLSAVSTVFADAYFVGTCLLFGVLWVTVKRLHRAEASAAVESLAA
ncbi:MAG TPA: glycosyltransferase family 87 protein [Candidatus Limnocylindrales bacterium]|nr:glycosyltransferase family 87 protein [Candidatus Limnocylindrales bacterium]